jgi:predicted nucleic acid-binding protein
MATNLSLDPKLIEEALKVSGERTKKAAVTMLVDTSVWSLAFRRDAPVSGPEVLTLRIAIDGGDAIVTTGVVLQELSQGFAGPRARKDIVQRFAALPLLVPDRQDYTDAADIRKVPAFRVRPKISRF